MKKREKEEMKKNERIDVWNKIKIEVSILKY